MSRFVTVENALSIQTDAELESRKALLTQQLTAITAEQKSRAKTVHDAAVAANPFKVDDKVRTKYMSPNHYGVVSKVNPKSVGIEVYYIPAYRTHLGHVFAYSETISPLHRLIRIEE